MRNNLIILCLLLLFTSLQAQEQVLKELSLKECIRLAWLQNPEMKNSEIGIREARVNYVVSIGSFLPRISAKSEIGKSFGRSIDPGTNGYTTESFEEGTIGLDMTLSLFEGFTRINRVRFQQLNKEKSQWEYKNRQNELAYQVTDAYYKLVLEGKLLTLAAEQSRLSERYLKQTETFVELGLKSRSDLQEVKARQAGDIYRYQAREKSLCLARLQLKQLLNLEENDSLTVNGSINEEQLPLFQLPEATALFEQSVAVMPTFQLMQLRQRAARKEYAMAAGLFSPSVYARFSLGSYYSGSGFSGKQLRENMGQYVGVGISIPLLSGLERLTNLRKQKLNIYRLQNDEELLQQQLRTDVEQTILSLRSGIEEHQQALLQVNAEAQVLKESERKWEEGLISVFQLMEARNRYLSARAELTRVRLQLEMSLQLENYYRTGTFFAEDTQYNEPIN